MAASSSAVVPWPWASDILNTEFLSQTLGLTVHSLQLEGIAPLPQSDIATLKLSVSSLSDGEDHKELLLFFKGCHMPTLRERIYKPDDKWRISMRSFDNEFSFFVLAPLKEMSAKGIHIPCCLFSVCEFLPPGSEFDKRLIAVLERIDPDSYEQHSLLNKNQTCQVLKALARFHAYFWRPASSPSDDSESRQISELKSQLFVNGAWWRKELRPTVKFANLPRVLNHLCAEFSAEFGPVPASHLPSSAICTSLLSESADGKPCLAPHLMELAEKLTTKGIDWICSKLAEKTPFTTLVHGDAKTSNVFFHKQKGRDDIVFIDWQWTGLASSGAADVVYLLLGGVEFDALANGGEDTFLRFYYEELTRCFTEFGTGCEYSVEQFMFDYDLEILDYCKTAIPQLFDGLRRADCRKIADDIGGDTRMGWLAHEYDERINRYLCQRCLDVTQQFVDKGFF